MTTTMTDVMTETAHASFGMPVAGRSRCSWQRGPVTLGVVHVAAAQKSVVFESGNAATTVSGLSDLTGAVRVDAVIEGAFPGVPAWSPPI